MEKECPYCKKTFAVQRIDSVYCSRSCRQMAYMERKLERLKEAKLNGTANAEQGEAKELLPVIATEKPPPKTEDEYQVYESKLLDALRDKEREDKGMSALNACIRIHQDIHSYWIGLRLRCLVECLLLFSEAKFTNMTDLMELCNAFTHMKRSIHYQSLPDLFPYRIAIDELRDKLKQLCIKAHKADQVKFRMEQKDKIDLILLRYSLAQFFPKQKFDELKFSTI